MYDYSLFSLKNRREIGISIRPEKAKSINEIFRLKAWAIYPITGGPTNIPTIPKVTTIEMANPGEYFLEAPAKV